MTFDNIDLNDTGGSAPKLDLNFGLNDKDNKSSGFGFGSSGWGPWGTSNASKSWDFANIENNEKDGDDLQFDSAWGYGSNKKEKVKNKANDGFDFDFGNTDGSGDVGNGAPETKPDNEWGQFTSVGKKDKKKKKGGVLEEVSIEPVVIDVPAPPAPATTGIDGWDTWGKKDKKKKKGDTEGLPPMPPPPPSAPIDEKKEDDDIWANFGSKKDKKKNRKSDPDPVSESVPEPEKEPESAAADDIWSFGSKKDKKKGKKPGNENVDKFEEGKFDSLPPNSSATTERAAETNPVEDWDTWTTGSKDKKKKTKKGAAPEPALPTLPPIVPAPVPEAPAEDDWTNSNTNKKDKKKTKKNNPETVTSAPLPPPEVPEAPKTDNDWMNGSFWGTTGKDKKNNKKTKDEDKSKAILASGAEENSLFPDGVDEPAATGGDDDWLSGWSATSATKSKKGTKKDPLTTVEDKDTPKGSVIQPDEVADSGIKDDDNWGIWGTGTRKKEKKKGAFAGPPPPVPTPPNQGLTPEPTELERPPPPPAAADDDIWGAFSTAGKKGKKETAKKETAREKREREKREKEEKEEKEKAEQEVKEKAEAEKKEKEEAEKQKIAVYDTWGTTKPKKESVRERKEREKREEKERVEQEAKERDDAQKQAQDEAERKAQEEAGKKKAAEDGLWGFAKTKKESARERKEREKREKEEKEKAEREANEKAEQEVREKEEAERKAQEEAELAALEKQKSKDSKASKKEAEDSPAKAVKGFWGSFGAGSAKTKTPKEKEKEKKEKEKDDKERQEFEEAEKARKEAEADIAAYLDDPIVAIVDEGPPKDSKKKGSKLADAKTKKSSKLKEEPKENAADPLIDLLDTTAPPPPPAADETSGTQKAEGWGFWGSSIKPTKKGASGAADTKKEISNGSITNEKRSLKDGEPEKLLEAPDADVLQFPYSKEGKGKNSGNLASSVTFADEVLKKDSLKEKKNSSSKKTSSVADKVKALQGDKDKEKDKQKKKEVDLEALLATDPFATDPTPPPPAPTTPAITKPSTKDAKKSPKSSKNKAKDPFPEPLDVPTDVFPSAPSPIPGGFPLDDLLVAPVTDSLDPAMPVATPKKSSKPVKTSKKDIKSSKKTTISSPPQPAPDTPVDLELAEAPADAKLAELKKKKERPKISKEQGASSSWGFWGATPTPKKSSKAVKDETSPTKDKVVDADAETKKTKKSSANKDARPTIGRSKSARKATDRDPADKASRSSGSGEMPSRRESERPRTSRGMSFSGLFGKGGGAAAAQPSMARRHSTREKPSRRHSSAVDEGFGLVTPPPDDADAEKKERRERRKKEKESAVNDKAAKVMGIGVDSKRRGSVRRKSTGKILNKKISRSRATDRLGWGRSQNRSRMQGTKKANKSVPPPAPDPYPIDDDIVMVDPAVGEDTIFTSPPPVEPPKRDRPGVSRNKSSKSKRDSKIDSTSGGSGDAILVDAPFAGDIRSGPEDLAFVETPATRPPLKRAATSATRKREGTSSGGMVRGLFGSFRAKPSRGISDDEYGRDKRRARAYESADEYGTRKKRSAAVEPDSQKRLRRDGRKVERSSRGKSSRYVDAEEGMTTDAAPREGSASDAEVAGVRRSKRKSVDVTGMSGSDRLAAMRREKDRMVRDAKKAKARERVEAAENGIEAQRRDERRARRKEEEAARREADARRAARRHDSATYERPKTDRRSSSYADKSTKSPDDDAARRVRREDRRVRHDRGDRKEFLDVPNSGPYKADAGDKTSSWVNSVNIDPPLPPPDQATVIDEAITAREGIDDTAGLDGIEDAVMRARRERKKSKRVEGEKRRGDERTMRSGDSSGDGKAKRRSMYAGYPDPAATPAPVPAGRRMSWFKGLF